MTSRPIPSIAAWKNTSVPQDLLVPGIKGLKLKSKTAKLTATASRGLTSPSPLKQTTSGRESRISIENDVPSVKEASSGKTMPDRRGDVVIHVFDENRNAKRDFYCRRAHLVKEMSYFANHLHDKRLDDLIEIDVHCDVEVFEWLMSYIAKKNSPLEARTVISILISSHFLQMVDLEEACLNFIHAHLNQVIQVPIDMRCVPGVMIERLSQRMNLEEFSRIIDPKDKLESKLYQYKLMSLLTESGSELVKCRLCTQVFSGDFIQHSSCDRASTKLSIEGEILKPHQIDMTFDIHEFIVALFVGSQSWKMVFWRIWGIQNHLKCKVCYQYFPCHEYFKCRRHIYEASYSNHDGGKGIYRCCNQPTLKFMPFRINQGCRYFEHIPESPQGRVYELYNKNRDFISWKTSSSNNNFQDDQDLAPIPVKVEILAASQRPYFYKWDKAGDTLSGSRPSSSSTASRPQTAFSKPSQTRLQHDQRKSDEERFKEMRVQFLKLRTELS